MEQCAEHVNFQLPIIKNRIKYLLDDISCSDADLQDTVSIARNDQGPNGMIGNFESTA